MPVFEYKALDVKGRHTSGVIDADSTHLVRRRLKDKALFAVSIDEVHPTASVERTGASLKALWQRRVKLSETAMLTRQLATLLGAGFPLVKALGSVADRAPSPYLRRTLAHIKEMVNEGRSFASALADYARIFSPLYVNMVSAGETSGTLEIVLDRLAAMLEKQQDLKNRLTAALAYPLLMVLVGIAVIFLLMIYVVPSITGIFEEMEQVLPAPTRFLIATSQLMQSGWWTLPLAALGSILGWHTLRQTTGGRLWSDRLLLNLPLAGGMLRKMTAARLSATLGSLLANGVTLMTALQIVRNIAGNAVFAQDIDAAAESVGNGQGLAESLGHSGALPDLALQMIQVGEQTGELESMLEKVAGFYESEVQSGLLRLTALLEPLLIVCMGGFVGFIVLSICLPIFEMNQLVR